MGILHNISVSTSLQPQRARLRQLHRDIIQRYHPHLQKDPVSEEVPQAEWMACPPIDALYDYVQFLRGDNTLHAATPIAVLPQRLWNTPIAIVGAGAAGLVAAYELLKIGAQQPNALGRALQHPVT
ncbi:MAG: hypothetical protein JO202_07835 [Ktedonobacteraceae bacterium]|nr:hypothetical protein [Ktedonobacteraceae bacterium]